MHSGARRVKLYWTAPHDTILNRKLHSKPQIYIYSARRTANRSLNK